MGVVASAMSRADVMACREHRVSRGGGGEKQRKRALTCTSDMLSRSDVAAEEKRAPAIRLRTPSRRCEDETARLILEWNF